MLERVGPGTLVIVPGDREDVILTLTTAHLARRFRVAGAAEAARIAQIAAEATNERTANVDGHEGAAIGLVLTGGYRPRDAGPRRDPPGRPVRDARPRGHLRRRVGGPRPARQDAPGRPREDRADQGARRGAPRHRPDPRGRDRGAGADAEPAGPRRLRLGERRSRARRPRPSGRADRAARRRTASTSPPIRSGSPTIASQIPTDVAVWPIRTSLRVAASTSSPGSQPCAGRGVAVGVGATGRSIRDGRGCRTRPGPRAAPSRRRARSISPRVSVSCFWTSRTSLIFVAFAMIAWRAASVARRFAIRAPRSTTWPVTSSVLICSLATVGGQAAEAGERRVPARAPGSGSRPARWRPSPAPLLAPSR